MSLACEFARIRMDRDGLVRSGPAHTGSARVWSDVEQTMIPQLARHVQHAALARRKVITRRRCEGMRDFTLSVQRLLEQERQLPQETRDAAKVRRATLVACSCAWRLLGRG